nr:AAA family ATPase [Neisseria meningitidis]
MIKSFWLENFGPISLLKADNLGKINLIIAENSKGKTFILKALYSVLKSHEEAHKGKNIRDFSEELRDKLYWTFQVEEIGDLVTRGKENPNERPLKLSMTLEDSSSVLFSFGRTTKKLIKPELYELSPRINANSIFLPPKEVLSLFDVIKKSEEEKRFGFDATYIDLVKALDIKPTKGRNYPEAAEARKDLEALFGGYVSYNDKKKAWVYEKDRQTFSINSTAEGVKKIGILDTLLGNRFLSPGSILFIDEPEANLHPKAINQFLEILFSLSKSKLGIQIFMSTHSYFVIKKLCLLARKHSESIPVFMPGKEKGQTTWVQENLQNSMPDNEIIGESIRLFREEIGVLSLETAWIG